MTGDGHSSRGPARLRRADESELTTLQDIERAAGRWFRELGMDAVADDEPPPRHVLNKHRAADQLWIAADRAERAVGYLLLEPVDGCAHIEQLTVHPDNARHGIGSALLEHAAACAAVDGTPALTLTAFVDVPWNAPYYERRGFRRLTDAELSPGLRRIRAAEDATELGRWPRVCMRRELDRTRVSPRE